MSVFCLGGASWKGAGLASDTADTVKVSIPGSGRLDSGGEGAHGGNTPYNRIPGVAKHLVNFESI